MKTSKKLYLVSLWKMSDVINVRINYNFLCVSLGLRALPLEKCLPPLQSVRWCSLSVSQPPSCVFSQVYKCSPSSRTPSQKAVPAATGRSRTATCWRPSTSTGTRTASSVPAVTAGWARWAPRSTPKPTSSCAGETTYGKRETADFFFLKCLCDVQQTRLTIQKTQSGHSVCNGVTALTHSNPLYTHLEFLLSSFLFWDTAHSWSFTSPQKQKKKALFRPELPMTLF